MFTGVATASVNPSWSTRDTSTSSICSYLPIKLTEKRMQA